VLRPASDEFGINAAAGALNSSWRVVVSFPLFDLAKDLAVARSGEGLDADSDPRVMRRRIAGIAWAPGALLVVLLGGWAGSWVIGIAGIIVLLIGLWLFAERADRISALVRRRLEKSGRR